MKIASVFIAALLTMPAAVVGTNAKAAGTYSCKGQTSFGQMNFKVKKGRVRGASYTFQHKVTADGSVRLSFQGEYAFLGNDGLVRGRGGAKTGPHDCDMAKFRAALKK